MSKNLSSQGADGLWTHINTVVAGSSISNRITLKTLTNSYNGGGGKINFTTIP
jgi:hypothetical protein